MDVTHWRKKRDRQRTGKEEAIGFPAGAPKSGHAPSSRTTQRNSVFWYTFSPSALNSQKSVAFALFSGSLLSEEEAELVWRR